MAIPSVGSPPSVAPSPLPNPHSQPASVPSGDQVMPTLSPHPPTMHQQHQSPPSNKVSNTSPDQAPKSNDSTASSLNNNNNNNCQVDSKSSELLSLQNNMNNNNVQQISVPILKRPILTSKEYETALGEEEQTLEMLYDYTTLNAWYSVNKKIVVTKHYIVLIFLG